MVDTENRVYLDPDKKRALVTSGKPLVQYFVLILVYKQFTFSYDMVYLTFTLNSQVPDYALKFVNGRSTK